MRFQLRYGQGHLSIDLEDKVAVLQPRDIIGIPNVEEVLQSQIAERGYSWQHSSHSHNGSAALVLDSPHHIPKYDVLTQLILRALKESVVSLDSISIIVSGLPTATYGEKIIQNLTSLLSPDIEIQLHDRSDQSQLVLIGTDGYSGASVYLNRVYVEASLNLVLAPSLPSPIIGMTGGPVSVSYRICGIRTYRNLVTKILANESEPLKMNAECKKIFSSISSLAPPDLAINVTPTYNGSIGLIASGSSDDVLARFERDAPSMFVTPIQRKYDAAIVSAGGEGYDSTLAQAVESLSAGLSATRTGGTVLLIAECAGGVGPEGFRRFLSQRITTEDIISMSSTQNGEGVEFAAYLRKVAKFRNLIICSRLKQSFIEEAVGCVPVKDPQEGIEILSKAAGIGAKKVLIPYSPFVVPSMRSS